MTKFQYSLTASFNSLRLSDAHMLSKLSFVQTMAFRLVALSHYLNQYWKTVNRNLKNNSCITRKPVHYTCGPAVAGQCRSGIGPRRSASDRSGIGSGALRHARMGIKNKSNDNKTTPVALLTSLLVGGICASGNFALQISPHEVRPLRAESCRGADFVVAGGIAGCQNDSLRCRRWRQGGIVATLCLPVPILSQNTWQYITKFKWSMWSYSSITIDDGGSSIWWLRCRWRHPGLSLWQLIVPPVHRWLWGCQVDDLRFSMTV